MKILIMGLPGAGKTTLTKEIVGIIKTQKISVDWFNADEIRQQHNDWDFSEEGRKRQSERMKLLADNSQATFVICDFIAPLEESRRYFKPDFIVWLDTIEKSRFPDTDKIFEKPKYYNLRIKEQNAKEWAPIVFDRLYRSVFHTSNT